MTVVNVMQCHHALFCLVSVCLVFLSKAQAMREKIGYPDFIMDDDVINAEYEGVRVTLIFLMYLTTFKLFKMIINLELLNL